MKTVWELCVPRFEQPTELNAPTFDSLNQSQTLPVANIFSPIDNSNHALKCRPITFQLTKLFENTARRHAPRPPTVNSIHYQN